MKQKVQIQVIFLLLFAVLFVAFLILRFPALELPFFWDELGVYGPASLYLLDNGVSMMPNSMPTELSRGHPLLCPFYFATWMKVFGSSLFAVHLGALTLSVALLGASYALGKQLAGKVGGWITAIFVLVQPVFVAQSTLVLPEILLAFLLTLALYFYFKQQYWGYFVAAGLAVLSKETAIVLPVSLCVVETLMSLRSLFQPKSIRWTTWMRQLLVMGSPLLVFALFLGIQKIQNSWFFFPYHTDLMSFELANVWETFKEVIRFLFWDQGRWLGSILFLVVFVWKFLGKDNTHFISEEKGGVIPKIGIVCMVLAAFVAFDSLNFFMERYTVLLLPILSALFALVVTQLDKRLALLVTILAIVPTFWHHSDKDFSYDYNLTYEKQVEVQKAVTKYLEEVDWKGEKMVCNFPTYTGLTDARMGYCRAAFENISPKYQADAEYFVISENGSWIKQFDKKQFDKIKEFGNEYFSVGVYKRKEVIIK